ncbi:unnamed protein product [Umbelopsis vinacea]
MGPLLGVILLFVFGVAAVVYFTRIGSSILYPTLVNCWYCNNNVFLPPNGLDNVEQWKCPICESLNVRNKVGDIVDSIPEMYDPTLNQQSRVSRRPSASKIINALCSNCDLAQQRILSYVTAFDPDNNDKGYLQHANAFKRKLEERYPLCSACRLKVDSIINERDAIAKSLMIDRCRQQLHSKPVVAIPSRQQARRNFYIQGILYWALHMSTLVLSVAAFTWTKETITFMRIGRSISIPIVVSSNVDTNGHLLLPTWVIAMSVSLVSWLWINWHPLQMKVYGYTGKFVPRLKTYQGIHLLLYSLRIATIFTLLYGSETNITLAAIVLFLANIVLLPYSLNILAVQKHPSLFEKIQSIQDERRREIAKYSSQTYDFDWDEDLAAQPTPVAVEPRPALKNPPRRYTHNDESQWNFSPQTFFPRENPTGLEPLLGDMNLTDPSFLSRTAKSMKETFIHAFD